MPLRSSGSIKPSKKCATNKCIYEDYVDYSVHLLCLPNDL